VSSFVQEFMQGVIAKNPEQKEFHQAVQEVVESLVPALDRHPELRVRPKSLSASSSPSA